MTFHSYVLNIAIALDVLASAVLAGEPGETLSGRAGTAEAQGALRGKIFAPLIDALMHLLHLSPTWRGHCAQAVLDDMARAQAVLNQNV